jgi:hypothetical protein
MSEQLKLEKISHVHVFTAMCENAQECWDVLKAVKDTGINHQHLNWHNDDVLSDVIDPLKEYSFFDGENWFQRDDIETVPFVQWDCLYDDVTIRQNIAVGIDELLESQLWKNLDKVV